MMAEREVVVGKQAEQRELKGYSTVTEVRIPLLQAWWTTVAVDLLAVFGLAAAVALGPGFWKVAMGVILGGATLALAVMMRQSGTWPVVLVGGSGLVMAVEGGLVWAEGVWPWRWLTVEGFWEPWPVLAVGPAVGAALLVYRFANELWDPFGNRPGRARERERPEARVVVKREPVFVQSWRPEPKGLPEPAPMAVERDTLLEDVYEVLEEAYRRRGLTRAEWTGEKTFTFSDGRKLSKGYFKQLVEYLVQSGVAAWDGPGTANILVVPIEEAMRIWRLTEFWESKGRPGPLGNLSPTGRAGGPPGGRETGGAPGRLWTGLG